MADEPLVPAGGAPVAPAAPSEAAVAPVAAAPEVAAPVAEAAPAVVEAAPELPTAAPTLIEEIAPAPDAVVEAKPEPEKAVDVEKPAEAPAAEKPAEAASAEKPAEPVEAAKPEEVKAAEPVEPPKPEPIAYKWDDIPESIKMDDEIKTEVSSALDAFRADPTNPRPLLDQAEKMMGRYAEQVSRDQHQIFADTRKNWRTEIMADPIMGGAGHRTAMQAVARARDAFVSDHPIGTPEFMSDLKAFNDMCHITGVGDHPVMLRMMHRLARFIDEPAIPSVSDIKPAPETGRRPGANPLHDNPRSHRNGAQ